MEQQRSDFNSCFEDKWFHVNCYRRNFDRESTEDLVVIGQTGEVFDYASAEGCILHLTKGHDSAILQIFRKNSEKINLLKLKRLVQAGQDVNARDSLGHTVLHEAARNFSAGVIDFLCCELKTNCTIANNHGITPLHLAAALDRRRVCKSLVDCCDQASKQKFIEAEEHGTKRTALHFAAKNDSYRAVQALAALSCNLNPRDAALYTPLQLAAELDRSAAARELISCGADVTVTDYFIEQSQLDTSSRNAVADISNWSNNGDQSHRGADSKKFTNTFNDKEHGKVAVPAQFVLVPILEKMTSVAVSALDKLHTVKSREKVQEFDLNGVEYFNEILPRQFSKQMHKSVMQAVTEVSDRDVLQHPVILKLIAVQWHKFGRFTAFMQLGQQLLHILIWTLFSLLKPWYTRYSYDLSNEPVDVLRLLLLIAGILIVVYTMFDEIREIIISKNNRDNWIVCRKSQISRRLSMLEGLAGSNNEVDYLRHEGKTLSRKTAAYWKSKWNIIDWLCAVVLFVASSLHIADCFENNGDGSLIIARWHVRIMAIGIVLLWLRLLKCVRPFQFFGPFVVTLGKILTDVIKFLCLYLEFFIPFACIFWTIIGGSDNISATNVETDKTYPNYLTLNRTRLSVTYFTTVDDMLFSLFRLTLIDVQEGIYKEMRVIDKYTCQVLVGLWFAFSTIIFLNLFIAQLSETFKNIYDNAKVSAIREQANFICDCYSNMWDCQKVKYHSHLVNHDRNSRKGVIVENLDIDVESNMDNNVLLRKATLQIRETTSKIERKLQNLINHQEKDADDSLEAIDDDDLVTTKHIMNEVQSLSVRMHSMVQHQLVMQQEINEVKEILRNLPMMMVGNQPEQPAQSPRIQSPIFVRPFINIPPDNEAE